MSEPVRKRRKRVPARLQVAADAPQLQRAEDQTGEYNIWYNTTSNYQKDRVFNERAETRCNAQLDSGDTKADLFDGHDPTGAQSSYYCIQFARGRCRNGPECQYYHRVPTLQQVERINTTVDVFGRERNAEHKADRGGTGSFLKLCRTLYVGRLPVVKVARDLQDARNNTAARVKHRQHHKMMDLLWRQFSEWGPVEHVSYKEKINCAFVRFHHRCHAEFAKIAMAKQALVGSEVINIRWAFDDPWEVAQRRVQSEREQLVLEALEQRSVPLLSSSPQPPHAAAPAQLLSEASVDVSKPAILPASGAPAASTQQFAHLNSGGLDPSAPLVSGPVTKTMIEEQKLREQAAVQASEMDALLAMIDGGV